MLSISCYIQVSEAVADFSRGPVQNGFSFETSKTPGYLLFLATEE